MTRFSPIKVSLFALMLASAGFAQAQAQKSEEKPTAAQTAAGQQKETPAEQKATQPADESQKQTSIGSEAEKPDTKPDQTAEKSTDASSDEDTTTPVTPQTKKSTGDAAADSTKHAMSEAEALPQGTPFVPDLNLYGPSTAELGQKLTNALRNDPALSGSSVVATVTDNSISLTGSVRTAKDRITARRIAESFASNRKVTEQITVAGSGINQSPAASSSGTNSPKTPSTPPPTSTGQKPESPNRNIDPVNAQEKPKPGSEY